MEKIIKSYSDPDLHRRIGDIIEDHSGNKEEIRGIARGLVDWQGVRAFLDLGCGYGWFEEALEGSFDFICGVDCLGENRDGFLGTAGKIAREAAFLKVRLPATVGMPSGRFDLVAAAYSLYFFPEMTGEVKRLLNDGGQFLVITHSESMLAEGERYFDFSGLKKVIQGFSAENGETLLREHFASVRFVDYTNTLVFSRNDSNDLAQYIDFKREFIAVDADPELVKRKMLAELQELGELCFNKNDRIFIAMK
jgi:SAM-dependent methyltransferase